MAIERSQLPAYLGIAQWLAFFDAGLGFVAGSGWLLFLVMAAGLSGIPGNAFTDIGLDLIALGIFVPSLILLWAGIALGRRSDLARWVLIVISLVQSILGLVSVAANIPGNLVFELIVVFLGAALLCTIVLPPSSRAAIAKRRPAVAGGIQHVEESDPIPSTSMTSGPELPATASTSETLNANSDDESAPE